MKEFAPKENCQNKHTRRPSLETGAVFFAKIKRLTVFREGGDVFYLSS